MTDRKARPAARRTATAAPRKRAERSDVQARIETIIDATTRLLRTKNLQDISMSDISAESGVPRTAMYNHFPNTASVFEELSRRLMITAFDILGDVIREQKATEMYAVSDAIVDGTSRVINESPAVIKTLLGNDPRYAILFWADEFATISTDFFHQHIDVDWPGDWTGPRDPFHTCALMLLAVMLTSVRADGHIGDAARAKAKLVLRTYLAAAIAELPGG